MADAISAKTAWALAKAIKGGSKKKGPTNGTATVVRVDQDGTHWVRISGSNVETPVNGAITVDAKAGDTVEWSIHDGRLSITGNESQPSVGMREVFQTASDIVQPVVARISKVNELATLSKNVADAAQQVADAVNQHFFSDTNGVHVTEATQEDWSTNHEGANVLLNAAGQLFRDGLNNLLTLTTENGARALTVWDGLGNTASNIRAIIGAVIQLGKADESHALLDYHSLQLVDRDSYTYFHVSDLRNEDGSITETFEGDGTTTEFKVMAAVSSAVSVNVDGVSASYTLQGTTFALSSAPASGATVEICYVPTDTWKSLVKAYTFGIRKAGRVGLMSVAEGYNNTASGEYSHAEGMYATTSGFRAHAEGRATTASGNDSHAEGDGTQASGSFSHAEGLNSKATDSCSHAEGYNSTASGRFSHAQNEGTVAAYDSQTAIGKYNANGPDNAFEIGNGTSGSNRSNALTVDWDGNVTHGVDVPWTNLQLASSVEPYSDGQTPRYRKWGPVVQVLGAVKLKSNQSAGFNVSIGTLPSGCRPLTQVATVCQGSGNDTWLCNVSAGGVMNIERYRNGGTNAAATTSTWLPFSITFLTA